MDLGTANTIILHNGKIVVDEGVTVIPTDAFREQKSIEQVMNDGSKCNDLS